MKDKTESSGVDARTLIVEFVRARADVRRLRGRRCLWVVEGEAAIECGSDGLLDVEEYCDRCQERAANADALAEARRTARRTWARMRRLAAVAP